MPLQRLSNNCFCEFPFVSRVNCWVYIAGFIIGKYYNHIRALWRRACDIIEAVMHLVYSGTFCWIQASVWIFNSSITSILLYQICMCYFVISSWRFLRMLIFFKVVNCTSKVPFFFLFWQVGVLNDQVLWMLVLHRAIIERYSGVPSPFSFRKVTLVIMARFFACWKHGSLLFIHDTAHTCHCLA